MGLSAFIERLDASMEPTINNTPAHCNASEPLFGRVSIETSAVNIVRAHSLLSPHLTSFPPPPLLQSLLPHLTCFLLSFTSSFLFPLLVHSLLHSPYPIPSSLTSNALPPLPTPLFAPLNFYMCLCCIKWAIFYFTCLSRHILFQ